MQNLDALAIFVRIAEMGSFTHAAQRRAGRSPPDLRPSSLPVSIVVAHRQNLSRRVRVFIDWLEPLLAPYLDP